MSKSKKYYVVWIGKQTGVFSSWEKCKKQVSGFEGAQYKSFFDRKQAEKAFKKSYDDYKGVSPKVGVLTESEKKKFGSPILESISVDAACSGNPGAMEYRGVLTHNKKQIFIKGPFKKGTNNIGEFLALVHGIALLKKKNMDNIPIYTDSKIAISWIKQKKCNTKIDFDSSNEDILNLIKRAETWLKSNSFKNPILKWETKIWGEIPADFGRK